MLFIFIHNGFTTGPGLLITMYSFYLTMKTFHVALVMLSVAIFSIRGTMMLAGNQTYTNRWFRRLTPLIDSILMVLGIAMAFTLGEAIKYMPWFWEKMGLLLLYIGFGIAALNRAKNPKTKRICFILAVASAAGMFHAALTKQSVIQILIP